MPAFDFTSQTDAEFCIFDWAFPDVPIEQQFRIGFAVDPCRGRGLSVAVEGGIPANEVILTLPWTRVVTQSRVRSSLDRYEIANMGIIPRGIGWAREEIFKPLSDLHAWSLEVAVFLVTEMRNPKSWYKPWWRLLPVPLKLKRLAAISEGRSDSVTDLLLLLLNYDYKHNEEGDDFNYGNSALQLLQDDALECEVMGEMKWLKLCYAHLFDASALGSTINEPTTTCQFTGCDEQIPPCNRRNVLCPDHNAGPLVSFESFMWAFVLVRSRAMELPNICREEEGLPMRVILPFIDMCNHSSSANVRLEAAEDGVRLVSTRQLFESDPILLDYGVRDLPSLARSFGFVPRNCYVELNVGGVCINSKPCDLKLDEHEATILSRQLSKLNYTEPDPAKIRSSSACSSLAKEYAAYRRSLVEDALANCTIITTSTSQIP